MRRKITSTGAWYGIKLVSHWDHIGITLVLHSCIGTMFFHGYTHTLHFTNCIAHDCIGTRLHWYTFGFLLVQARECQARA
jgi:hypothetical protein